MSKLSAPYLHDEAAAHEFVESVLWPQGAVCPHCGGFDRITKVKANAEKRIRVGLWRCGPCKKQFTVKVGTVFEDSKIKLNLWVQAIVLMTASKKGISAHQMHRTLEVTYKTAWFMEHRIREAMRSGDLAPFGAGGGIVEVDETFIGIDPKWSRHRPNRRGFMHKNKVLALVDRTTGQSRAIVVDHLSKKDVYPILKANIACEARIMTDEASMYRGLSKLFADHQTVNHGAGEYGRGETHTNTIEGYFSIFKRGMKGIYQHCGKQHLHRYVAEFEFRYNNRSANGVEDHERAHRARWRYREKAALPGLAGRVKSAPEARILKPKKITVEPSAEHPGILNIRDAMQQVLDYFDLLTDQETGHVVWNLTFASTNSPFTAEGTPVDLRTNAPAFGLVADYVARIDRGLIRLAQGEPLGNDFPADKRPAAERILKRNLNGIGRTRVTVAEGDEAVEIAPINARRSLDVMQGVGDALYDSLFGTFAHKEVGAIEGRIVDLGTDYDEPAVKLREHRSGREIQCRISKDARDEIEGMLTAGDVWQHRRVRVRGVLNYDPTGKLVRVYDGRVSYIDPPETKVSDLRDPDFTGGLPAYDYLERIRDGVFDVRASGDKSARGKLDLDRSAQDAERRREVKIDERRGVGTFVGWWRDGLGGIGHGGSPLV